MLQVLALALALAPSQAGPETSCNPTPNVAYLFTRFSSKVKHSRDSNK